MSIVREGGITVRNCGCFCVSRFGLLTMGTRSDAERAAARGCGDLILSATTRWCRAAMSQFEPGAPHYRQCVVGAHQTPSARLTAIGDDPRDFRKKSRRGGSLAALDESLPAQAARQRPNVI